MLVPAAVVPVKAGGARPGVSDPHGYLEKVDDFEAGGRKVLASRLGYRITARFADQFLGRLFEDAGRRGHRRAAAPGKQTRQRSPPAWTRSSNRSAAWPGITSKTRSVEAACPPLKALLHIIAHGVYAGMGVEHAELRAEFTRGNVLESEWLRRTPAG